MQSLINGIAMTYAVSGPATASAVVLHHPLASNLSFWDEATAALEATYRVVRFDARGHGRTEAPTGPYEFAILAQDVVMLLDHLGIGHAHFVGLSMGGMIGQVLALRHADRLRSLTIASATSRVPEAARPIWADRIATARKAGMAALAEQSIERWLTAATRARHLALVERCADMVRRTPVEGYAGWGSAIAQFDVADQLGTISLPTLIVAGAEDPGAPPLVLATMQKGLHDATLVTLPNLSHFLAIEDPVAFHAVLIPFLAKHST